MFFTDMQEETFVFAWGTLVKDAFFITNLVVDSQDEDLIVSPFPDDRVMVINFPNQS